MPERQEAPRYSARYSTAAAFAAAGDPAPKGSRTLGQRGAEVRERMEQVAQVHFAIELRWNDGVGDSPQGPAFAHGNSTRAYRPAPRRRDSRLGDHRRPDGGHGRRSRDRPRGPRLVPRHLGGDDGRDDVPLDRTDGGHVRARSGGQAGARQVAPVGATTLFVAGYLVTWTAAGLVGYAIVDAVGSLDDRVPRLGRGRPYVAGAVIVGAAVYQLTPLKDACLTKCRSPLAFLLTAWRPGRLGALRMGIEHGAWCVGCCWALMAALFALGVMSLGWMALIAALIATEKLLPWKAVANRGIAVLLAVLGLAVGVRPRGRARPHPPGFTRGRPGDGGDGDGGRNRDADGGRRRRNGGLNRRRRRGWRVDGGYAAPVD